MADGSELGKFLQSRRARISPEQLGLVGGPRRRVRGLRREEVAQFAGISVEYYVRLEQGRATRPSDEVLDAIARALHLTEVEQAHLRDLARLRSRRREPARARTTTTHTRVRPELAHLLAAMDQQVPALVINFRMDVLAWNRLATQLFFDFDASPPARRNLARFAFLDPASQQVFLDWPEVARATVGALRLAAGRHPEDAGLAALLGELSVHSGQFGRLWAGRDVKQRTHGVKRFANPLVGELSLHYENFELPGESGQRLITFTAPPDSPAHNALRLLALWTLPSAPADSQPTA